MPAILCSIVRAADLRVRLLEGVEETSSEYRFEPLGLVVRKGADDVQRQLYSLGLATEAPARWWPWVAHSRLLPRGVGRATASVTALMARGTFSFLASGGGVTVAGLLSGSPTIVGLGSVAVIIALSLILHETAHVVVFRVVAPSESAIIVVRGGNAALLRRALTRRAEVLVVCAGPCAPAIAGVALLPLAAWSWLLPAAWGVVALAHLVTVVLPFGDGANLRAALRR